MFTLYDLFKDGFMADDKDDFFIKEACNLAHETETRCGCNPLPVERGGTTFENSSNLNYYNYLSL